LGVKKLINIEMIYMSKLLAFISFSVLLLVPLGTQNAFAVVENFISEKDNTLYDTISGDLSNGAGNHFFVGNDAFSSTKRGVISFDLSSIPPGAVITNVELKLEMSRTIAGSEEIALHKMNQDWGEGTSHAPGLEGGGATSTVGDASWLHTFFSTDFWTSPGSDFDAIASDTLVVNSNGLYTWSSLEMISDVQGWADDSSTNFGWLLKNVDETDAQTAKRFDTKENESGRPMLTVEYTVESSGIAVGGEMIPLDSTMILTAGAQYTAAWMIPAIVSAIGIAIVIARKF
jgi:hypothetical protein